MKDTALTKTFLRSASPALGAAILKIDDQPGEKIRDGSQRWLIHTDQLMAAVIDIDNGPWDRADPPHSHPHEQITYVAEGEIEFQCEGLKTVRLKAGDLYAIPPNLPHTIQLLSKTARLVDAFTPLREDFLDKA